MAIALAALAWFTALGHHLERVPLEAEPSRTRPAVGGGNILRMRHQQDRGRGHLAYRLKGDGDLLSVGIEQANPGKAGQQAPARSPVAKPDPSADHTTAMEPGWA